MESALYGIYAIVGFVSEMERVRATNEGDLLYVNNSCVNTVRAHFPWRILDVLMKETSEPVLKKKYSPNNNWLLGFPVKSLNQPLLYSRKKLNWKRTFFPIENRKSCSLGGVGSVYLVLRENNASQDTPQAELFDLCSTNTTLERNSFRNESQSCVV